MKRMLVLGGTGQVGYELQRSLSTLGEVLAPTQNDISLMLPANELEGKLTALRPDIVINAAAYTAVDQAETEREKAHQINAVAPGLLASYCEKQQIPLIHFSTDYVFDGTKNQPWKETDTPNPINVYGETKLAGENVIRATRASHLILRTSWVYGARGKNFFNTMKRLATEKSSLSIVNDQLGAPTWSRHLGDAVAQLIAMAGKQGPGFWQTHSGTYHLTNAGETSWYDFAQAIFDEMQSAGHPAPEVEPISSDDYPVPAPRPAYSVLDCGLLEERFAISLPDWRQTLSYVMQDAKV
ncbi:dTDP-4-dehydrorhamnose reductase [uncultured Methylophaga sp.]|uniref:dTDP-4-dehydrorhamnose reductase n=1 Tax=uncultured Methylophaga sp. TaxID=285271 RepID=UPI0026113DF1|nr:dTDP-4-dehydrorhamnose reductase [uncultured Methylophaga sp.]